VPMRCSKSISENCKSERNRFICLGGNHPHKLCGYGPMAGIAEGIVDGISAVVVNALLREEGDIP